MKNKKILIVVIALVLVAGIAASTVFVSSTNQEPVGVYPFTMIGMDGYWGDSQESYGPVSTDKIQTVFLSDTQTVTEILVAQGDKVKKGDVLMSYDTTLSDLQLEKKRLEVEKYKLQLDEAKAELKRILALEPMKEQEEVVVPEPATPAVNYGSSIPGPYVYTSYIVSGHDGRTPDSAFICWLRSDTSVNTPLLDEMRQTLWKLYGMPDLCEHGNLPGSCVLCEKCPHGKQESVCEICSPAICEHGNIAAFCEKCHLCPHGSEPSKCTICRPDICVHGNIAEFCEMCHLCPHGLEPSKCTICRPQLCEHKQIPALCPECIASAQAIQESASGVQPQTAEAAPIASSGQAYRVRLLAEENAVTSTDMDFYVVFKTTEGDGDLGATLLWQGIHVTYQDGIFNQQFFVPVISDYTQPEMPSEDTSVILPDIDLGSGMTATQIADLRIAQELKIKDIEFDIKMATAEYKIMQKEISDGHIYAEIDGQVAAVLSEEEAKTQNQPVVKVSGGGGFFIQGSVSELEKDDLKVGQEVTVNDWNSGGVYTGTVKEIGDFPSLDGYWNGTGNPNTTYYPFTVFVGEDASLQAGNYASIQYSTSESSGGIYLEKPFIRSEDGRSYVFVRNAENRLEKRFVTTGKTLWGSYVEVTSGVTAEDYLAFPYGKNVKSGAPAEEKDLSELYGY